MKQNLHKQAGFTLAELAILLAVLSIVASSMMMEMVTGSAVSAQETTIRRMQAIEQAMIAQWISSGRIPCPAPGNVGVSSSDFGKETGEPGNCNSDANGFIGPVAPSCTNWNTVCVSCSGGNCGSILGTVPVRNLNLPDEYALDGWNRRISYVVDERFTSPQISVARTPAIALAETHAASPTIIGNFPALLISHGQSGSFAFPISGSTVGARPVTRTLNSTETGNLTSATFNNRFVSQPFRPDLPSASGRFDQMVRPITLPK